MSVTLHGFPFSTYTWSARLALHEKGVPYELVKPDTRSAAYAMLHPFRKMPVLDDDGFRVYEAAAVLRYVDEAFDGPALQPTDVRARARMTQWVSAFNDYVATAAVRGVLIPRFVLAPRGVPVDDAAVHAAASKARHALAVFDDALASSPWLAGEEMSLADLLLAPVYASGAALAGADRFTDDLPNIDAWFARLSARPAFVESTPL
jgi:glutathione S-transferase